MPVDLENVILPAVAQILGSVGGVANVNEYIRVLADDAAFNNAFYDKTLGRIHGYTITRESTSVVEKDAGAALDQHVIVIRGYMGVQDQAQPTPTEQLFQDEIEAVRTAFFAKRHLEDQNGTRLVFWCLRIAVRTFSYVMFSGVLCHYAELVLVVRDYPIS